MHYSPQIAVLEGVASTLLFLFCLYHLWCFDQFESLTIWRWRSLQAFFRRLMVIIYLLGLPMFAVSGVATAVIKYKAGFLPMEQSGNPVPYYMWPASDQKWLEPLAIIYSLAWLCEIIVHAEETCFWWYLTSLKPHSGSWYMSTEVKVFAGTSLLSVGALLAPGIATSNDPLLGEAIITTIGSGIVLIQNLVFFVIIYKFPDFLLQVSTTTGSHVGVIVDRLVGFHEMNKIRIVCRMVFCLPSLALGIDGLKWRYLNSRLWVMDVMMTVLFLGFVAQALITFLIFLPRTQGDPISLSVAGVVSGGERGVASSFYAGSAHTQTQIQIQTQGEDKNYRRASFGSSPYLLSPEDHPQHSGRSVPPHYPPPPPLRSQSVHVGRSYFDIEPRSDLYQHHAILMESPYMAPGMRGGAGLSEKAEDNKGGEKILRGKWVTPEMVTEEQSERGRVLGKRPSLVLRPKMHPSLANFRSPIDIDR